MQGGFGFRKAVTKELDTQIHTHRHTHIHTTPCVCPILEGMGVGVRPFDPQLHFIYECESTNFFLEKYIYFFSISSCIFPRELSAQTGIEKKKALGGGGGL